MREPRGRVKRESRIGWKVVGIAIIEAQVKLIPNIHITNPSPTPIQPPQGDLGKRKALTITSFGSASPPTGMDND